MNKTADYYVRKACGLICHQKPERCFTYKGYLFPLCARCTGILISFVASLVLLSFDVTVPFGVAAILVLVMFADWILQALKIKESTNRRRFVTGLIGGFGMSFFFYSIVNYLLQML